jgi:hypothetical protein
MSGKIPLDFENLKSIEFSKCPDIMILPSNFNFFSSMVNGVLFINPKYLFKNNDYGTFAKIMINPDESSIDKVTKVEIVYL